MQDVLLQSALFKLCFATMAVTLFALTLRWMDWTLGISFGKDVLPELKESDGTAIAIYYGLRLLAVAIVIGAAIG
jgi:hypothetical protein